MTKKVTSSTTAIARWDETLAKYAKQSTQIVSGLGGAGTFIKTRGGLFYKDMPVPDNRMRVIVIAHELHNMYYKGKFDPNDPTIPDCYAFGSPEGDAGWVMKPHEDSADPQSEECRDCPQNQWGTADVGRGKACKNAVRMSLMVEGDLDDIEHAETALLHIPPTSGKAWGGYVNQIDSVQHRPPFAVITEIQWAAHPDWQFTITAKYIDLVPDSAIPALIAKHDKIAKEISFPYVQIAAAEKPQRKGKRKF